MYCIETTGLSYRFSEKETVLSDLDIQVPEASIYGFLGPNGAGKTTTLRLILGLLRKQAGSIRLFGQSLETQRLAILKKTGSLIEAPSIYSQLTAAENLAVLQKVYQCPKKSIGEMLAIVGLSNTGTKRAGKFSLGMKQRLSIAMALLHKPSLLILDEPTNGLDPEGIIEIRELLKSLNREQGTTIVISSHLLPEIEKLATHTGIIHKGKLLFQGTLDELQHQQSQAASTVFFTGDAEATAAMMRAAGQTPVVEDGRVIVPLTAPEAIAQFNEQLVRRGIAVYGISTRSSDLESIFIDLIKTGHDIPE